MTQGHENNQTNEINTNERSDERSCHDAAFLSVADPEDWKRPIDAYISADRLKLVCEAIEYYTATKPEVEYVGVMSQHMRTLAFQHFGDGEHIMRVRAAGYRNGPAGDH